MRKVVYEEYQCEFCGLTFESKTECEYHEETHLCDYKYASNKTIIDALQELSMCAYGYRIGETVMGIPISNYQNLLNEAAKRLCEED